MMTIYRKIVWALLAVPLVLSVNASAAEGVALNPGVEGMKITM